MAKIHGTWNAFLDDFIVNYDGEVKLGSVTYSKKVKKGKIKAKVWYDSDQDGVIDNDEKLVAKYKAEATTVFEELDFYSLETGNITINDKNGKFKLFHDGDLFAKGKITDMDFFFD